MAMPLWVTACGIASIGAVNGYILFYSVKRYVPPVSGAHSSLKEVALSLMWIGIGGTIGAAVISLDGVNYIGPYGMGLLAGVAANVAMTIRGQHDWYRRVREGVESPAEEPEPRHHNPSTETSPSPVAVTLGLRSDHAPPESSPSL